MEKDTKEEIPSDLAQELEENYEDYDYADEYVFGTALGNFKDDPASKRSRPRNTPVSKLTISDEETIPKMPTTLLIKPNEKEYQAKMKDFEIKIQAKVKSIEDLKKERRRIRETKKGNPDKTFTDKNKVDEKVKNLFSQVKAKEEATKIVREKLNDVNSELKLYEKLGVGQSEKRIMGEINSIQEQLSFGEINVTEEKRLNDRKSQLEEYLEVVKRCKPIREESRGPLDELNKLRKELKDALKEKYDVYTKLGLPRNKKEWEERKAKEQGKEKEKEEDPEINRINIQIEALGKEKKAIVDEKWKTNEEYNNQWYEYEEQQNLIDYINRANEKIKRLKEREAYEKKLKKKVLMKLLHFLKLISENIIS